MPRKTTPSFVLEIPLVVSPHDDRVLAGRLEAGRRVYNATLGAMLGRVDALRQDPAWALARAMPTGPARPAAYRACREQHAVFPYACQQVAAQHRDAGGFTARLGGHPTQAVATRVWKAIEAYAFAKPSARRGRPRFKGSRRPLHSLEGKDASTIRWVDGQVCWNGLTLSALIPSETQDPYLHLGLQARTKYVRVLWRMLKGRRRWYVQLVQEGVAPAKYAFHQQAAVVGLDLGPSTVAIVGDNAVALVPFAPSVVYPWAQTRRLQRTLDRSRRAMNPGNYHPDGRAKTGARSWTDSARLRKTKALLADLERRLAAGRKRDHGTLANQILALGTVVQMEQLSYTSLQRGFGRSVQVRAPGMFVSLLRRKAESAGGAVVELNTRVLKMSQYDHVTDSCTKKPLHQRWHPLGGLLGADPTRVWVQRDCYSALLAQQVVPGETHAPIQVRKHWTTVELRWREAGVCVMVPSASGVPSGAPTVLIPSELIARGRSLDRGHRRYAASVASADAPRM